MARTTNFGMPIAAKLPLQDDCKRQKKADAARVGQAGAGCSGTDDWAVGSTTGGGLANKTPLNSSLN